MTNAERLKVSECPITIITGHRIKASKKAIIM